MTRAVCCLFPWVAACSLSAVELSPTGARDVLLLDGVTAEVAARFADASDAPDAPMMNLAITTPSDGAQWPENLSTLGVTWAADKMPPKADMKTPCEVTLRGSRASLRVYVARDQLVLPGERLRALVGTQPFTIGVRCAADPKVSRLLRAPDVRVIVGPALAESTLWLAQASAAQRVSVPGLLASEPTLALAQPYALATGGACDSALAVSGPDALAGVRGEPLTLSEEIAASATVALDGAGAVLAVAQDDLLRLFDTLTGALLASATLAPEEKFTSVVFSRSSEDLYAGISTAGMKAKASSARIVSFARAARGELAEPLTLVEAASDALLLPSSDGPGGLLYSQAKGKLDDPKEGVLMRFSDAAGAMPLLPAAPSKASDRDPVLLPAESDAGYLLFASTRVLSADPADGSALFLAACTSDLSVCDAPLWWPMPSLDDTGSGPPTRALLCSEP